METRHETRSPAETQTIARRIAETASSGDVLALFGELGAGKTEFVKGFAEGLGLDSAVVSSPTFTLIHEYEGGRLPVYHFDAYRVKEASELVEAGLDEYLFGSGVCLIEWPERIEHLLPEGTIRLRFEHGGGEVRIITIESG